MYRNAQRGFGGGNEFYMEPSTPPVSSRPSSQRKSGEQSPNEFSPGLLDLHSFDTELLPEVGDVLYSSNYHIAVGFYDICFQCQSTLSLNSPL